MFTSWLTAWEGPEVDDVVYDVCLVVNRDRQPCAGNFTDDDHLAGCGTPTHFARAFAGPNHDDLPWCPACAAAWADEHPELRWEFNSTPVLAGVVAAMEADLALRQVTEVFTKDMLL